jgi:hypothetical protein
MYWLPSLSLVDFLPRPPFIGRRNKNPRECKCPATSDMVFQDHMRVPVTVRFQGHSHRIIKSSNLSYSEILKTITARIKSTD